MPVEDPIPDWTNVINDTKFHGVARVPTVLLRFDEREITHPIDPHHAKIEVVKILQQMWETSVINNSQTLEHIVNPGKRIWRDVEVRDESEDLPVDD